MSLFGKIFGGKSSKPEPTTQGALQDLGGMEELLIKKQEYLNRQIETVESFWCFIQKWPQNKFSVRHNREEVCGHEQTFGPESSEGEESAREESGANRGHSEHHPPSKEFARERGFACRSAGRDDEDFGSPENHAQRNGRWQGFLLDK